METTGQSLDILWILICAALVMLMQAGFSCLESGMVRTKNSINVAAKNFADFCLSSAIFWLFGFGLMFGISANGLFGTSGFLFDTTNPWLMAFFIFQLGFCGTATTIVSGAVAERMRFGGYLVVAIIISAVIYPVIGHWVWGSAAGIKPGGWLEQMGFIDFAGSTVVHSVGGWISLAAIIIIGPRIGRFGSKRTPIHGHDIPIVTLGVFLLWFGWFGFNGGSTLGLTPVVPTIIVNTTISGAFGGVVALALAWRLDGQPDVTMIMNGSLAGLVGITASAHIMTPLAAVVIGSIAAVFMYVVTILLERFEIDDVVGAVPVHLSAGIWGTLAVAIFADPEKWGTGLGRWEQLVVQAIGIGATFVWAFGVGFVLLWLINRWVPLRIDPRGERIGLNVAEHGASTEILDLLTDMDTQRRANDYSQPVNVEPHTEIGQIARQYNRVLADINAEQTRRELATESLKQQTKSLQLLQETGAAANRAKTIDDAIRTCLESICAFGGWQIGHCFTVNESSGKLVSAKVWHLDDAKRFAAFRQATEEAEYESGVGLPGRVMASGEPEWLRNVNERSIVPREKLADKVGIKGGAAFPVLVGEEVVAVLEFFALDPVEPKDTVLEVIASVGTQLGRIVERVRSETARFNSVIDNMPANVYLRNKDGHFILVNRNYENFYGVTNDSVRGKKLDEIHGNTALDQMIEKFAAADREVIQRNTVIEREYKFSNGDGSRTIIDRTFPIVDPSGEVIAVGGVELDITELKRTEEALAEKETQLRVALDHMPGGMMLFDRDFNYVLFNARYSEMFEYPDGLIKIGGSLRDAWRFQAERGDFGPGDTDDLIEQVVATRQLGEFVSYERVIAGSGRTLQVNRAPTPDGGNVSIVTDITDRKLAEDELAEKSAMLEATLENMDQGITMVDRDLNTIALNRKFLELQEFPEEQFGCGFTMEEAFRYIAERGEYGPGDIEEQVRERLELTRKFLPHRFERTRPNGTVLEIVGNPIEGGGFVSTYTDITERKRAEEALQEAYEIIKDQKERMEDELNIGREIQMGMVPLVFPPFPDRNEFSIFAALEPAREVGGDFYDFYFIDDDKLCVCIGDVSGKGVPAALFMAMAKTLIKSRANDDRSTASILTHVNEELSLDNKNSMFVTIFAAILNLRTGELGYTNAGHNPPYIKRKDGTLQRLDERHGPVVGAKEGIVYNEGRIAMESGDMLYLYTDGVTEAMNAKDRLFSEERLTKKLASKSFREPKSSVTKMIDAVMAFAGDVEQADDITVLALAFHGSAEDEALAQMRIVIKNQLLEIDTVNKRFASFAEEFGISRKVSTKFNIIFDELLNNVISYAYRDDFEHDIEVKMEVWGNRLVVTVADDGVPFNPLNVDTPDISQSLEEREIGGMGIHLVRNLIGDVSYQRHIGKNITTMIEILEHDHDTKS